MKQDTKHVFALFYPDLSQYDLTPRNLLPCEDKTIVQRLSAILRLRVGDSCILFDSKMYITARLHSFEKKSVVLVIESVDKIVPFVPSLTLACGLLKKEAFEMVCYYAAQLGVQEIVPLLSAKVQRKWGGVKELDRLNKIMIAACEQAKQFSIPTLRAPIKLSNWLNEVEKTDLFATSIFLDVHGAPFAEFLDSVKKKNIPSMGVLIGPEGDFSEDERKSIIVHEFSALSLTKSVLRSQEAALASLSILRTFLRK